MHDRRDLGRAKLLGEFKCPPPEGADTSKVIESIRGPRSGMGMMAAWKSLAIWERL